MQRAILSIPALKTTLELLKEKNDRLASVIAVKDSYEMGLKDAKDLIYNNWERKDYVKFVMSFLKKNSAKHPATTAKLKKHISPPKEVRTMEQECEVLLGKLRDSMKTETNVLIHKAQSGQETEGQAKFVREIQVQINMLNYLKAKTEQANER